MYLKIKPVTRKIRHTMKLGLNFNGLLIKTKARAKQYKTLHLWDKDFSTVNKSLIEDKPNDCNHIDTYARLRSHHYVWIRARQLFLGQVSKFDLEINFRWNCTTSWHVVIFQSPPQHCQILARAVHMPYFSKSERKKSPWKRGRKTGMLDEAVYSKIINQNVKAFPVAFKSCWIPAQILLKFWVKFEPWFGLIWMKLMIDIIRRAP